MARVEDRTLCVARGKKMRAPITIGSRGGDALDTRCLFEGCMQGRTLYVVPFSMGPLGSPISQIGVELSDSPYVVVNMRMMTRMGKAVIDLLGQDGAFVPCVHTVGAPLAAGQQDVSWPCNATKYIVHFPETARSGLTARATVATPCWAKMFCLAHCLHHGSSRAMAGADWWAGGAHVDSWVQAPGVRSTHVAAAFPSACGRPISPC